MSDPYVWLYGLIGVMVQFCPPKVKNRWQSTGQDKDDLSHEVCTRLIATNGNPKKDELGWEELVELTEDLLRAMAAGIDFKETEEYQRIRSVVSREVYRVVNGSTTRKRQQRGLAQVDNFSNFDPADEHGSRENHAERGDGRPERRNGRKRRNGKRYEVYQPGLPMAKAQAIYLAVGRAVHGANQPELPMASELLGLVIDLEQVLGNFGDRELEILRGVVMEGKTLRELGNELASEVPTRGDPQADLRRTQRTLKLSDHR